MILGHNLDWTVSGDKCSNEYISNIGAWTMHNHWGQTNTPQRMGNIRPLMIFVP